MMRLEKLTKPTVYDHLRQSCFYYLVVGYDILLLRWVGILITLFPLILNAISLYWQRKETSANNRLQRIANKHGSRLAGVLGV
jgi:hypothetical protein